MDKLLSINPMYIVTVIVIIAVYYYFLWWYGRKLKKINNIKNINSKGVYVNNFHIFDNNFVSARVYNKNKILPGENNPNKGQSENWTKLLEEIQDSAEQLNTNNQLDNLLSDMDIDTKPEN